MPALSQIESLIGEMTLAEKLGQLTMTAAGYAVTGPVIAGDSTEAIKAGTIGNLLNLVGAEHVHEMQRLAVEESRLRIPLLIGFDVVHGHRTVFPVPLAEAGLFDPRLWELTAREAAIEAAADGIAMAFAPMLDVARDPRWGRGVEGPGEDPFVGARFAEAKVRGFQGRDLAAHDAIASVAKHYCAYGAVNAGRDYGSVDVSERALREVYLPPFEAAIAAGAVSVMPAFTDIAGVPMTANVRLLQGWLRERLKFNGVIVTDYHAIAELVRHGIAADLPEAAALALAAGVDIDMMSDAYRRGLPIALERGLVGIPQIDTAVRRVLELKERLGLFADPYRRGATPEVAPALAARHRLARDVAARAVVMLTNRQDALPLSPNLRRLAVIGPLANSAIDMRGPWWGAAAEAGQVTVLEGMRAGYPDMVIEHAPGVAINDEDVSGIDAAVALCGTAQAILLCVGESASMSGEAACRAHLDLPGQQRALCEAVLKRAKRHRVPVIVVLFSGRALIVPWLIDLADAVLAAWFLGSEAGNAIADVVTGKISPGGRTVVSWARALGQVPIYFGERPGGRPDNPKDPYTSRYMDVPSSPLFPFGHGLTYGRFRLANLRVTPDHVAEGDTIEVRVDVTNEGARLAEETVFLFTHDKVASVSQPVLALKGFAKIALAPNESGAVTMHLSAAALRFIGMDLEPVFEAGEVEVLVGPCADRSQLLVTTINLTR
jgi:beta-glucosidase